MPESKQIKKRGGWKNPASAANGAKNPGKEKQNLLIGLKNLETGETPEFKPSPYFPSMKAAALSLGIDIAILKNARLLDCPAFRSSGNVHRKQLIEWIKKNDTASNSITDDDSNDTGEYEENYDVPDEVGGVGQTLKSLQAYERRTKKILDQLEKSTNLHSAIKAEKVKAAQDAWLKVVNALLKYDLSVKDSKRESGELIPIKDAQEGIQGLLAWHSIATSDALRNVIPNLEGKNRFEIAALLDPELRASIYRNFKMGRELGKIPEWMEKTAVEFIRSEPDLSLSPPAPQPVKPKRKVDLTGY